MNLDTQPWHWVNNEVTAYLMTLMNVYKQIAFNFVLFTQQS